MKKFALLFAAMLAMVQINAAAGEPAGDDEKTYQVSTPFSDDDESTKHWTVETSGFYIGMGVDHSWEAINNSFEVGLLNIAALNYNSLHGQNISLGVGIHHRSYSIKRPLMLVREEGSSVVTTDFYPNQNVDKIKDRSSNLNMWAVQFPLMFNQKIYKKLSFSLGAIMDWNFKACVDNHYELDKVEHDTRYNGLKQNKLTFDFMGGINLKAIGVYCRYSPSKFFKDGYGPEIKNTWTLGLVIGM